MIFYCTFLPNFWVRSHKETKDPPKPNPTNLFMPCHFHAISMSCHCNSIFMPFQAMPCHTIFHAISTSFPCDFHAFLIHVMACYFHAIAMPLSLHCHAIPFPCHFHAIPCHAFPCLSIPCILHAMPFP
jgi:hypothetical protein